MVEAIAFISVPLTLSVDVSISIPGSIGILDLFVDISTGTGALGFAVSGRLCELF